MGEEYGIVLDRHETWGLRHKGCLRPDGGEPTRLLQVVGKRCQPKCPEQGETSGTGRKGPCRVSVPWLHRWIAVFIRLGGFSVGASSVCKAFRILGIRSETKHQLHYKPRKTMDRYPNLIFTTWETVDSPRQVIVPDMAAFSMFGYITSSSPFISTCSQNRSSHSASERGAVTGLSTSQVFRTSSTS